MEEKKRTITKVEDGEKVTKTAKKVVEVGEDAAAEKKVKKVETLTKAEEKSKATTLRIVSAILWVLAIGFEVLAILFHANPSHFCLDFCSTVIPFLLYILRQATRNVNNGLV